MEEINVHNIPAYQRKRSLSARSRKPSTTPKTISRQSSIGDHARFTDIPIAQMLPTHEEFKQTTNKSVYKEVRELKICGEVEGYYEKINVVIVKTTSSIKQGDRLMFEKDGGMFEQTATSIQIDRKDVKLARTGSDIGMKVALAPKVGTYVYKEI